MIQTYLGFDVGKKRIGVAIGNNLTKLARGIDTIINHANGAINWDDINKILKQYKIDSVIIGIAFNADGSEQEMTFISRSFAKQFNKKFNIKCILIDEFLSSLEAKKQLKYNHYHKNAKRSNVDKKSAEIILQDFLNEQQYSIKK